MSKEELVSLMGPPTNASPKPMTWTAVHYLFYSFLEQDGLQCKEVRTWRPMLAQAAAKAASSYHPACELATQSAMSTILGATVVSEAFRTASGRSKCVYTSASGNTPYAELSVDRGDWESGMAEAGFVQKNVPGMVSPSDGTGDPAVSVGPALYVRTGDDLVTIVLSGVKDRPAAARTIPNDVKARI